LSSFLTPKSKQASEYEREEGSLFPC